MIFNTIAIVLITAYALLIGAVSVGWWKLKEFSVYQTFTAIRISIIVAVRNEAGNIEALIRSLSGQDYPSDLYDIIIVNDHSDDKSTSFYKETIERFSGSSNLKLITLQDKDAGGKKAAILTGIKASSGELIVITDADCTAGSKWISTLAAFYAKNKPQMILGPVRMTEGRSFFGKLQKIEFASLISTAAGSSSAGFPLLANGANMAFTRHAYESCGGFSGHAQYPSGDDMFLMMSIKKQFGAKAIRFLRSEDAIVNTPAISGLKSFIQQRMRWVSKSRGYTDPWLITASLVVYLTNVCMAITAFGALFFPGFLNSFLIIYFLKLLIDLPLLVSFSHFQRSLVLLWLFPLTELLNAVYTSYIGIAGNIGKYEWKGRIVSTKVHNF